MSYIVILISSITPLAVKLKCFNLYKLYAAIHEQKTIKQSNQMSTTNTTPTIFDGIHVSKGFVRGLQGQVLKLEQIQQSLIQQLEHANKLASEYHATAVMYHQNYNDALHEMDEVKQTLERETLLRNSRERELEHFKNLLQEQLGLSSNSRSPSPDHAHRNSEYHYPNEPMSPVSVASLSPRPFASASRLQTQGPMLLDPETPNSQNEYNDNDDNYNDDNYNDNETEREFQMRYYYDSQSSRTTDCSGDPICHSDSD